MAAAVDPPPGRLAENIAHFARALRVAGLPIGPRRVVDAVRAVEAAGVARREDFFWTLHANFVSGPEQRDLFRQTFDLFWRDPQLLEKLMAALIGQMQVPREDQDRAAAQTRAREALSEGAEPPLEDQSPEEHAEREFDATLTFSADEILRARDFEQMTAAEARAARAAISRMSLPVQPFASRRSRPAARGAQPDWRAALRGSMRAGGALKPIPRRAPKPRWPSLVALCDISGSMAGYSRMLLHFLHAASNSKGRGWSELHAFTFGTRLTNITRQLAARDPDAALEAVGREAQDWEGGTRIGASLRTFNRDWSRRVTGRGAVVLLITDGLDRDALELLAAEAQRLSLSARKVIWLNPLLRWDGFAPKAQGVRALLPHVDSFRAAHNIDSLAGLVEALSRPDDAGEKVRMMEAMRDAG